MKQPVFDRGSAAESVNSTAGTSPRKAKRKSEGRDVEVSNDDFKVTTNVRTTTLVARRSTRKTSTTWRTSNGMTTTSKFFSQKAGLPALGKPKVKEEESPAPPDVKPLMNKLKRGPKRGVQNTVSDAEAKNAPSTPTTRSHGKRIKSEEINSTGTSSKSATARRERAKAPTDDDTSKKSTRGKQVARKGAAVRGTPDSGRHIVKKEKKAKVVHAALDAAARAPPSPTLMTKASLIIQVMDALYPNPPIPIDHTDNFTLLCGVLLSAQTTDAQVNLVTKELFRLAPDPTRMSKVSPEKVQGLIRSVGLAPTKAKHLVALSQQLLDRFDGQVPSTYTDLQSLPGVGRKTASVVMAQAFGMDTFPVDTHIHRLALRWGLTKHEKNVNKVEEDMMWVFPRESWSKLHLQLIYFGREHCQARIHDTSICPVCSWVKKTGATAPRTLLEVGSLQDFLACPTPPKKSSKNAIVYSERQLELEQFRMKLEP